MNRNQFIILLALVVVLGAWGLNRMRTQSSSWEGGGKAVGQKVLGEFAVNDVAQISVKHGADELTLAKKNDLWRVAQRGDYPANFSEISSLLLKLKDLKVIQTETVGASQLPRLELAPSGTNLPTIVEFKDASGKALKTLTLGKKHMKTGGPRSPMMDDGGDGGGWPDGRYVMSGAAAGQVSLVSDPLANLEPKADSWLNKDFFKIEKPRSIAVTFPNATNSWKLARETEGGELKLADAQAGEVLDSSKASGVGNPFSSPSIADVAAGVTPATAGLDKATVIAVETFEGFAYTIKVGAKTNENYFLTMSVAANLPQGTPPRQGRETRGQGQARQGIRRQAKEARRETRAGESLRALDLPPARLVCGLPAQGAGATLRREERRDQERRRPVRSARRGRQGRRRQEVAVPLPGLPPARGVGLRSFTGWREISPRAQVWVSVESTEDSPSPSGRGPG